MEFYKEAFDKVYGSGARPVNMMVPGNHDIAESYYWAQCVSHSQDPAVYKENPWGQAPVRVGTGPEHGRLNQQVEKVF